MLKIAVVASDYKEGMSFIQHKFRDKIASINQVNQVYTLKNGDTIHLIHGDPNSPKSMEFDAYCVTPAYETLEDVIKYRCMR